MRRKANERVQENFVRVVKMAHRERVQKVSQVEETITSRPSSTNPSNKNRKKTTIKQSYSSC